MFLTINLCTHPKLNCLNRTDNLYKKIGIKYPTTVDMP